MISGLERAMMMKDDCTLSQSDENDFYHRLCAMEVRVQCAC